MKVQEISWRANDGWQGVDGQLSNANLVLYFGGRDGLADGARYRDLKDLYPKAHIMGCSTGGQICGDEVHDDAIIAAAVEFASTKVRLVSQDISGPDHSLDCGTSIGKALAADDLAAVFVLSDGLNVNGTPLVQGISQHIRPGVPVSGGMAGDGALFEKTLIGGDFNPCSNKVVALGLYGPDVRIGNGMAGGWDVFGPRRSITRSSGNVLHELDGRPALALYERYLGEEDAKGLPGTGLLFPIQINDPKRPEHKIVRTILSIDREAGSMTFAGDVPEGWDAQLMRGDFEHLEAGAGEAAKQAVNKTKDADSSDKLAILVSCVGRRWLLGQRIFNELEAASAELGPRTPRIGFYSYGEIAPHPTYGDCELHNQTMGVTTISEVLS